MSKENLLGGTTHRGHDNAVVIRSRAFRDGDSCDNSGNHQEGWDDPEDDGQIGQLGPARIRCTRVDSIFAHDVR